MATFKAQVEGITSLSVGTTPTDDELSQFLVDGTKEVINRIIAIGPDEIGKFTLSTNDASDAGIVLQGQVFSVVREHDDTGILRACSPINPGDRYAASDSTSLSYRSKYNPGFYVLDGKIHTVPASAAGNNDAIVTQVAYAINTGHSSSSIDNFPDEYEYLVVLYASLRTINANMGIKTITDQALTPVLPDAPVVPNFAFTVSTSLPTYSAPTTTINATDWATAYPDQQTAISTALAKVTSSLTTIDGLGLAKLTLDPFSITAVTPDIPTIPNFTITPTVSLPSYTKLITSYDPGDPTDLSDVHPFSQTVTDIAAFTGITAVAPDSPTLTTMAFTGAGADASVTLISTDNTNVPVTGLADVGEGTVSLPTAPIYVPPAPPDRPDFESAITDMNGIADSMTASITAEDVELVSAKAQQVQAYQQELASKTQQYTADLGAYQAEIADAVNEFNEANVLYQAGIQKALADAQQDNAMITQSLQKNLTIAQADATAANSLEQANKAIAMQNAVTDMQEIVNKNNFFIQEWQQELAVYQAEVGTEVQDYQTKLSKYNQEIQKELTIWQQERQGEIAEHGQKIARFQALVGDELNVFNTELQKYQAEVKVMLQESQYEQQAEHASQLQQYQAEVGTYGAEVNSQVQEYTNYLAEQQQEFTSAVTTYQTLIQTAQAFAAEIQMRLAPKSVEIQEYQARVGDSLNSFNTELQKYQTELQKVSQKAQYEQQAEHAAQLQQYQAEVATFGAEVNSEVQDYSQYLAGKAQAVAGYIQIAQAYIAESQALLAPKAVEIQEYQSRIGNALNLFNTELQKYQAELQKELQEAQYEQQAEHASQLQQYQAEVATYQAEVGAAIQEYQNNLQADQAEYTWLQDQYTRLKAEYDAAFIGLAPLRQAEQSAGERPRA